MDHKAKKPLQKLQTFLTEQNGATLFCTKITGRRAILLELFSEINLHPETVTSWRDFLDAKVTHGICVAPLDFGLWLDLPPEVPPEKHIPYAMGDRKGERAGASPPSFRASAPPERRIMRRKPLTLYSAERLALICESQLFGEQVQQRRLRKGPQQDPALMIRNLTELQINAPVVHIDHGVGRYLGLEQMMLAVTR